MGGRMTREQAVSVLKMVEAHGSLVIKAKEMAIQALEDQKVGRWIFKTGRYFPFCSECDTWIDVEQGTMDYNYCMNCGAKMENVKELWE